MKCVDLEVDQIKLGRIRLNYHKKDNFNDLNIFQSDYLQKFYLKQLKKKESYLSQIENPKESEIIKPKNIIDQINLLENGEIF